MGSAISTAVLTKDGQNEILASIQRKDSLFLDHTLIDDHQWVLLRDADNRLPIHHASKIGHREMALHILKSVREIQSMQDHLMEVDAFGCTPLWYAVRSKDSKLIESLFWQAPNAFYLIPNQVEIGERKRKKLLRREEDEIPDFVDGYPILIEIMKNQTPDILGQMLKLVNKILGPTWFQKLLAPFRLVDLIIIAIRRRYEKFVYTLLSLDYSVLGDRTSRKEQSPLEYSLHKLHFPSMKRLLKLANQYFSQNWIWDQLMKIELPLITVVIDFTMFMLMDIYLEIWRSPGCSDQWRERIQEELDGTDGPYFLRRAALYGDLKQIQRAIELISEIGGSEAVLNALHTVSDRGSNRGYLPWHLAACKDRENPDRFEFLIWLSSANMEFTLDQINCKSIFDRRCIPSRRQVSLIAILNPSRDEVKDEVKDKIHDVPIFEEDIMEIRHRVYFNRSLTRRLLYFVG